MTINHPKSRGFKQLCDHDGVIPSYFFAIVLMIMPLSTVAQSSNSAPSRWIFLSSAMPREAILSLVQESVLTGATCVFRGWIGGSPQATWQYVRHAAAIANAQVVIDPVAFTRFQVERVPTFVQQSGACAHRDAPEPALSAPGSPCEFDTIQGMMSAGTAFTYFARKTFQ